jgi:hypothetical protein
MRNLRNALAPIAALIMALLFVLPAAAQGPTQPAGPGVIKIAPTAEYNPSVEADVVPLLTQEFVIGVTGLMTTTQKVEMTITSLGAEFLVGTSGGGYTKELTFTFDFDDSSKGGLYNIDPNGQQLEVSFASSDDQPGYTIQIQAVAAPDSNATAAAPAGSGTQSGSSLPATSGNSADDSAAWLQQSAPPVDSFQAFPVRIDGRHLLILAVAALGAIGLIALRRRRAVR